MGTTDQSTITSKGQVTIPQAIRDAVHLQAGERVQWQVREDGVIELRRARAGRLEDLAGFLHTPGMKALTLDEMDEGIAEYMRLKHAGKLDPNY